MSRGLWFMAGAGASAWAMLRARRTAEAFTPDGFADRVAALQTGWGLFASEVRRGRQDKETELRRRLAGDVVGRPALQRAPEPQTARGPEGGRHRRTEEE